MTYKFYIIIALLILITLLFYSIIRILKYRNREENDLIRVDPVQKSFTLMEDDKIYSFNQLQCYYIEGDEIILKIDGNLYRFDGSNKVKAYRLINCCKTILKSK